MVRNASTANLREQPLRVLLIEDHPDLAVATAEALEAEGLDVRMALSGHEALEIAATFQPELLLCDMNLPDISGPDVVRQLRAHPSTGRAYIVMLTGMGGLQATDLQVDLCMTKPINFEAIAMLVRAARSKNTQNAA